MHKITVLQGPASLPAFCLVKLEPDQVRRRRHLLEATGDEGCYRTLGITHFKTGEALETDADIPKPLQDQIAVEGQPVKPRAKAKVAKRGAKVGG